MAETKRDRVWGATLELALDLEEFDVADVMRTCEFTSRSKRTTRDVLATMADQGWIEKATCSQTGRRLYRAGQRLPERSLPEEPR